MCSTMWPSVDWAVGVVFDFEYSAELDTVLRSTLHHRKKNLSLASTRC